MANADATKQNTGPELSEEDAEELIRALGLVFSNVFLYGINHGVTRKAVNECFLMVSTAFDLFGELSLHLTDEAVMVNTVAVERRNPLAAAFAKHMTDRDLSNFTMSKGLDREKFFNLMEILNARPEDLKLLGGLAGAIKSVGLQHVKAQSVVYKRVSEDEAVVAKTGTGTAPADVQSILDFLRRPEVTGDQETVESLKNLSSDTREMGRVVVDAAQSRQREESEDESLTLLVVDSLRRMYALLVEDKSVKTQKGKKDLIKTLEALEKEVKERIRQISGVLGAEDESRIDEAVEGMADELRIDALVSEYMGKRSAVDKNEERLLRFMKAKGLDKLSETELEQRLMEGGLTPEGWHELLAKSGIDLNADADAGTMPVIGRLAELLNHIQTSVHTKESAGGSSSPEAMKQTLLGIDAEVKRLVAKTKVKIETMVQTARDDASAVDEAERQAVQSGRKLKMPRRKLYEILAEIAQEICQPLAVIQCSLEMMGAGGLGPVTDGQADMLKLSVESAKKLKKLTDNLMLLSGLPTDLSPDAKIQEDLYR